MALNRRRQNLLIYVVIAVLCKYSEEKCFTSVEVHTYCDSLQDLYEQKNFTRIVTIGPLERNQLETLLSIPVQATNSIERLTIFRAINNISEDAFKNFISLQGLYFRYNKIQTIPTGIFNNLGISFLQIISCGVKQIHPGSLSNLKKLEVLRLSTNNLTAVSKNIFNNLTVHTLSLSANQITHIDNLAFSNMSNLKNLYLDNNYITEFDAPKYITYLSKLEKLWLHKNNLTQITKYMVEGLSNLKVLNLGFNRISSIEPQTFTETPKLNLLVLTFNLLEVIDGNVLPANGLPNLSILYLNHNKLMYLSSNFLLRLSALKSIALGGNPWLCPCLDLVLRWLANSRVKLSCDKDYFSGSRPVCVISATGNDICTYSYDKELYEIFRLLNSEYPPDPICLL